MSDLPTSFTPSASLAPRRRMPTESKPDRILRWPDLRALVGLSRTTVTKLEHQGCFPRRHKLTDYCVGWREKDIQAWIAGRRDWTKS